MNPLKKILVSVLTMESRIILRKYKPFIVAVTGSVGKTSTKDAIYCALKKQRRYVRKSEKSMNSEIGLPLTVIGVPNAWRNFGGWISNMLTGAKLILWRSEYPDCLILEIGADHPGDIRKVAKWLKPDVAVITRVSRTPVHVEFFSSPEQVFEEKASLARAVKSGGAVVLYGDDSKIAALGNEVKARGVRSFTFGTVIGDVIGSGAKVLYTDGKPSGYSFSMTCSGRSATVEVKGAIGQTYLYPFLAAAAVAKSEGIAIEDSANALAYYEAPRGRMSIVSGKNDFTIIDDTYNSSPDAAISALETLRSIETKGKKIAVLADMMELGKFSAEQHRAVGKVAVSCADVLVTVGQRSRLTADEAIKDGMAPASISTFDTADEAISSLAKHLSAGDVVLVKGSQSTRMERVVKALMEEPSRAADLLVRQEKEWLDKK